MSIIKYLRGPSTYPPLGQEATRTLRRSLRCFKNQLESHSRSLISSFPTHSRFSSTNSSTSWNHDIRRRVVDRWSTTHSDFVAMSLLVSGQRSGVNMMMNRMFNWYSSSPDLIPRMLRVGRNFPWHSFRKAMFPLNSGRRMA